MTYTTLITLAELAPHLGDPDWALVDCRFALNDPALGRQKYRAGHIPGAVYADLDQDLSGPVIPGQTGRHPLPPIDQFVAKLSAWGIDDRVQVVAYDDSNGIYAGRLWWMLRWLGHERVAVLDGGWQSGALSGHPQVGSGEETRTGRTFVPRLRQDVQVTVAEMVANLATKRYKVFDVRDEKRYRGEPHPLDTRSGHIPGARSAWYLRNLDAEGKFLPPEQLRARYAALLGDSPPEACVFYCGSGVSVHHDLLALAHAGFAQPRVYIGSWSEWTADPNRPVATGETP